MTHSVTHGHQKSRHREAKAAERGRRRDVDTNLLLKSPSTVTVLYRNTRRRDHGRGCICAEIVCIMCACSVHWDGCETRHIMTVSVVHSLRGPDDGPDLRLPLKKFVACESNPLCLSRDAKTKRCSTRCTRKIAPIQALYSIRVVVGARRLVYMSDTISRYRYDFF